MRKAIILLITAATLAAMLIPADDVRAETAFEKTFDSLFVIASSGEVRFRDQNEPAMDSIAAYGVKAVPLLIDKFTTKSARERWTVLWTLQRIGKPAVPDLILAIYTEIAVIGQVNVLKTVVVAIKKESTPAHADIINTCTP